MHGKVPVNILLVDDQPAKLMSYEAILADLGENLIRANSGEEALEHLLRNDVAVLLVDVCMPEIDGFELASLVRQHPRFEKTSIILVSGVMTQDDDRLKGYYSGAVDYVSVPIVPEILRAKVSVFADLFRKNTELVRLNRELEARVAERTAEIDAAATRLRENQARLRLVLTSGGIGSWTWDLRTGGVVRTTPSGEERWSNSLAEFLGEVHAADRGAVEASLLAALDGDGNYTSEFRVSEGGERWLLARGTVVKDPGGRPLSIAAVHVDITDRRRAEAERALLLQQAQDANRLKDEFLATLSHELRTPLNAITGWAHLLLSGGLDEATQRRAVETIMRNGALQTQLISDILDVSRIIAGKLRLNLEPVEVTEVLQAALDTVGPLAQAKGVHVEAELQGGGGRIMADPARLEQVIWNLLSNAIKFAPAGGHVRIWVDESRAPELVINVRDDGPGIPDEFLPYIFDRFRQADSSSRRPHHGLGLGLAIARHLMELHGGSIRASNSENGTGAVFQVTLPPRLGAAAAAETSPAPGAIEAASEPEEAPSLDGIRVLVVDDDADAREVTATILERCGAEVRVAACVADAVAIVERETLDLLIADIEMPGEDGYALLRRVRALVPEKGGLTPAVAVTAYASSDDRAKALNVGFQMHLAKPIRPAELVTIVAGFARDRS